MRASTALALTGACLRVTAAVPVSGLGAADSRMRLIKTSPEDQGSWIDEHEEFDKFVSKKIGFVDITDSVQGTRPTLASREEIVYPNKTEHMEEANKLLSKVSIGKPKAWLETFSGFHTRHYRTKAGKEAATWLFEEAKKVAAANPAIRVRQFEHASFDQPSVIAQIPGSSSNSLVILGSHLDSRSGRDDEGRAPGADDDGTGTVVVLEALRVMAEARYAPLNTLEFHFYAAEEAGLRGSADVFDDYKAAGKRVLAMLQQDMAGYSPQRRMAVVTDYVHAGLTEFVKIVATDYLGGEPATTECGFWCSDHYSAVRNGFPAAFVFEDEFGRHNPYIHSPEDTIEKIHWPAVLRHAKFSVAFMVEASHLGHEQPVLPSTPTPAPKKPWRMPSEDCPFWGAAVSQNTRRESCIGTEAWCSDRIYSCGPLVSYNFIDGAEAIENYQPGGYHPIAIGDVLHNRYRIVDKLGFGGYSTVWLAHDAHRQRNVAVKVGISDSVHQEIKALRALSVPPSPSCFAHPGRTLVPTALDEFEVRGPNGVHPCYTMAPARCNLSEVSYSRLFPLQVARALCCGLAQAVTYTHSRGCVHGDIHLRNVLVRLPRTFDELSVQQLIDEYGEPETAPITRCDGSPLPPNVPSMAVVPLYLGKDAEKFTLSDTRVLLSDYGKSFSPAAETRHARDCHKPLAMRPPEGRFEPDSLLSYSADIWSLATAIWEIIGMKVIFSGEFTTPDEVTAQQIIVLGPMPAAWWEGWGARHAFFDEHAHPKHGVESRPPLAEAFEEDVQKYRRKADAGVFGQDETSAILDLMRRMLVFEPDKRLSAEEVLASEWMVEWALTDYERSLQCP